MERVQRMRRQSRIYNVVEILLIGLCLTATVYGLATLNALPSIA